MTNSEAIKSLRKLKSFHNGSYANAIRMAISALESKDGDTISRKAAIDALMAWEEDSFWDKECLKHRGEPFWVAPSDVINQMPSTQPENVFEIGKPYPLKGFEFKMWKDAYGGDWVEIRKYQESWKGEQDG